MKHIFLFSIVLLCSALSACASEPEQTPITQWANSTTSEINDNMETYTMYITVNGTTMTASMVANSSTAALKELLSDGDISIEMSDYANFEKVGELPQSLPTNNEQITTEPGDLILYLGRNFVIYYDTNTWNFTRLGKIDGLSEQQLKEILGTGDCVATLSLTLPSGIKETGDDNGRGNAYYRIDGTKAGKSAKGLVIDRNTSTKSFRR